jgi:hypothetical protein
MRCHIRDDSAEKLLKVMEHYGWNKANYALIKMIDRLYNSLLEENKISPITPSEVNNNEDSSIQQ